MLVNTEEQQALRSNLSPGWKSDEPGRLTRFGAYVGLNGHPVDFCCMTSSIRMSTSTERTLVNREAIESFLIRAEVDFQEIGDGIWYVLASSNEIAEKPGKAR